MRQSHLKNALVNLMVHQLNVTGPQIRQINQIFRQLDKNGDGTISHSELTEGKLQLNITALFTLIYTWRFFVLHVTLMRNYRECSGLAQVGLPQWDINRIIQSIDVDDSGNVSYTGEMTVFMESGTRAQVHDDQAEVIAVIRKPT